MTRNQNPRVRLLKAIKELASCQLCGESEPVCLDFHHVGDKPRLGDVSQMNRESGVTLELFVAEVERCAVVCSNCHRKITYQVISDVGLRPITVPLELIEGCKITERQRRRG